MVVLRLLGALLVVAALAACGGDSSPLQLADGSQAAELPAALDELDDAVLTKTEVTAAMDVDQVALVACDQRLESDATPVVERVGIAGSSWTFRGESSSLHACEKIPDPIEFEDPDNFGGGIWCAIATGRLDADGLNDPRLDLCQTAGGDVTGFAWIEPLPDAKWVVVSDAGTREVYEVAESLPVRVTTTDGTQPQSSLASFDVEEYAADGTKLREYVLETGVAG